jgi:hypothetical protein
MVGAHWSCPLPVQLKVIWPLLTTADRNFSGPLGSAVKVAGTLLYKRVEA